MLPALMHATQVPRPFHTKGWVYEEKIDGWRMLALKRKLAVLHRGYESMVARDAASPYVSGRTLSWLKVRQPKYREGERGWEPKA